jgi:predicted nucleic acid-binding protein
LECVVFDTEALLAYYLGEAGGEAVMRLLESVSGRKVKGCINIVNLAELYYILHRKSPAVADEKVRNLRAFGVEVVGVDCKQGLWKAAAQIKSGSALSLADAFAAATAKLCHGELVTGGDPELDGLGIPLMKIRRS